MSGPPPDPAPGSAAKAARSGGRLLFRVARIGVLSYLGVILVLQWLENRFVYHPILASADWQAPPAADVQDVELTSADGTRLHAWWCALAGADSAMLYCQGNAGNLSHRGQSVLAMRKELGVSVLIFDYPGYGKSKGRPSEAGCYAAANAGYDWLVGTARVAPERIVLYGGSLGGGVAVELASRRPHRALVVAKTFTSIPDVGARMKPWLPVRWLMRNRYDNLTKIPKVRGPTIITSATADAMIPFGHGEQLFAAANEPKLFYPLEGADHNDPLPLEFLRAVRQFLEKVENAPPPVVSKR